MVSNEKIKKIVKDVVEKSYYSWKEKKLKKGIDTHHWLLDQIAPEERLTFTIVQSLQTSLGIQWEELTRQLAVQNSFKVCDVKTFKKPSKTHLNYLIDKWHSKREMGKNVSLRGYIKDLKREIKKNQGKFKEIEPKKVTKGDGVDVWLKKNNKDYLLELKSPHSNAGNGNDFSKKLMRLYHHHLFWNPKAMVKALIAIPYNPFKTSYEKAESGRISPLIKNQDYLVDNDYWKFITGNKDSMKMIKKAIKEIKEEGSIYEDFSSVIESFKDKIILKS